MGRLFFNILRLDRATTGSLHPDLYEPQALARNGAAAQSSGKSSFSVDTEGSGGKPDKDKVEAKSEVRVYGRGKWKILVTE